MAAIRTVFTATANKAGKVTASAEKRAALLNSLGHGEDILAIALNAKGGALKREAAAAVGAQTLESLLASPTRLTGRQGNTLKGFLVAEYGEARYNRACAPGALEAMAHYLTTVKHELLAAYGSAETAKRQAALADKIELLEFRQKQLAALQALEDADRAAQAQAVADALAASVAAAEGEPWPTALDAAMVRTANAEDATPAKAKSSTTKKGEPKPIKGTAHAVTA